MYKVWSVSIFISTIHGIYYEVSRFDLDSLPTLFLFRLGRDLV